MGHKSLAVIMNKDDLLNLSFTLIKYKYYDEDDEFDENFSGALEFKNVYDLYKDQFSKDKIKVIKLFDGTILNYSDPYFYNDDFTKQIIPENAEIYEVPISNKYTYIEYLTDFCGYRKDKKTNQYGYWFNPICKFDYIQIGGKYSNKIKLKNGEFTNIAKISDIDFSIDNTKFIDEHKKWDSSLKEYSEYKTAIEYALCKSSFSTDAVLDQNGYWHERGSIIAFDLEDKVPETQFEWVSNFYTNFFKNNLDAYLIMIDYSYSI